MRSSILFICLALLLTACQKPAADQPSAAAKRYPLKGKVVSVDRAAKKAKVEHEEIPGFMEPMTMDFPIHEDWIWDDLTPGSEIRAELVVDNAAAEPFYLEKVAILAAVDPNRPVPINDNFAQLGKPVPVFNLVDQDGKKFTFKDYEGKTLALTFIYRDCPLPEYCIKMSRNFSDLANVIAADDTMKDKYRLLSISFDPARDTPAKLKAYGEGYLGKNAKDDLSVWQLAVGTDAEVRKIADFFGLQYKVDEQDKTVINHSLITAVIGPDGTVRKIFKGNEWANSDLLAAMKEAAAAN